VRPSLASLGPAAKAGGAGARWAQAALLGLLGLACGGCASLSASRPTDSAAALSVGAQAASTPPRPEAVVATLPATLAGIADARAAFAALFDENLRANLATRSATTDTAVDGPSDPWLHGVWPRTGDHAGQLATLKRSFRERAAATSVLLVPGMFGDCVDTQSVPFGDGLTRPRERSVVEAYGPYADLGLLGIRQLMLPGRASSAANGALVAQAIRNEAQRAGVQHIVLIGYSKGTTDAMEGLVQLQAAGGVPPAVKALVSVAGLVMGTPIADRSERWYEAVSPQLAPFNCSPSDGHEVASVTRRERGAWLAANPLPGGLRYYSITAHAAREHIAPLLRPVFDQLSAFDVRNDGQLLASDAILPRSVLLAQARADHWDVALPRDQHPNALLRTLSTGRAYPREALFRSIVQWVVGESP
jgi:hypothetical protein